MSSQTVVTTRMEPENKNFIVLRNVTHPNMEQKKIYSALKFKQTNVRYGGNYYSRFKAARKGFYAIEKDFQRATILDA